MERDEAELARVARGARDDHAAGVKERAQAVEQHGAVGERPGACGRGLVQHDERVHGDRVPVAHDERVHVDARHIGAVGGEAPEPHQHGGERVEVDGRLAAKGPEEPAGAEPVDHPPRFGGGERRAREDDVAEGLGEDAAQPQDHARPELRVAHHAGEQLAAPGDHLGDEEPHRPVLGAAPGEQLGGGRPDGRGVGEPEPHEVALGLVRDRLAAELDRHREAERHGRAHRSFGIVGQRLPRDRHAVGREQLLRGVLGEGGRHRRERSGRAGADAT